MNMNNEAEYISRTMNEKLLQDHHIDSKGSRLSTRSKRVPISRNKDFFMRNMKQGVYTVSLNQYILASQYSRKFLGEEEYVFL
jgi:hypothetical protein